MVRARPPLGTNVLEPVWRVEMPVQLRAHTENQRAAHVRRSGLRALHDAAVKEPESSHHVPRATIAQVTWGWHPVSVK